MRRKSREIFITGVLNGKKLGLLQAKLERVEVYFDKLHLGTIDESLRFIPGSS